MILNILVLDLNSEYALKIRIFTYKKNLKIPESLYFFFFFFIRIFKFVIYVFLRIKIHILPRKWLRKCVCHTYERYVFLRIPNLKIPIYMNVIRINRFSS